MLQLHDYPVRDIHIWRHNQSQFYLPKGQLISKVNFGVFEFTKKQQLKSEAVT